MSYYSVVSASNPQIWWRMRDTGSLVRNSASDATYSTISGSLDVLTTWNSFSNGAAVYSNKSYFPHADISCSLVQSFYGKGSAPYCSSSVQSILTGIFDQHVTGGTGLTAEWLMRPAVGGGYSNNCTNWAWNNSAGSAGIGFRTSGWPEAGTHYFKMSWINAANSSQSLEVGWGNYYNREYPAISKWGLEFTADQGPSGSWGPHNGWHHFVMTASPTQPGGAGAGAYYLWIDGLKYEIDYAAGTNPPPSGAHTTFADQKLYVGGAPGLTYAAQQIAEVAFYNRQLPDTEIVTHWAELAKWNTNLSATVLDPTGSMLYSVQAPAGNINYVPASSGTGNDPRATKTNPGAN